MWCRGGAVVAYASSEAESKRENVPLKNTVSTKRESCLQCVLWLCIADRLYRRTQTLQLAEPCPDQHPHSLQYEISSLR